MRLPQAPTQWNCMLRREGEGEVILYEDSNFETFVGADGEGSKGSLIQEEGASRGLYIYI